MQNISRVSFGDEVDISDRISIKIIELDSAEII